MPTLELLRTGPAGSECDFHGGKAAQAHLELLYEGGLPIDWLGKAIKRLREHQATHDGPCPDPRVVWYDGLLTSVAREILAGEFHLPDNTWPEQEDLPHSKNEQHTSTRSIAPRLLETIPSPRVAE